MDLSTRQLFLVISKQLDVPAESMEKFIMQLEGEFIMKAEQLSGFSSETLHKDLGLPIGISIKIKDILNRPIARKTSTPKPRRARGLSVTQGSSPLTLSPSFDSPDHPISREHRKLIKQSWLKVSMQSKRLNRYFHSRLFKKCPELENTEKVESIQTGKILEVIITNLGDVSIIKPNIIALGNQYKMLGVNHSHSPVFRKSLQYAIEKLTKRFSAVDDVTEEFSSAWESLIIYLVSIMFNETTEHEIAETNTKIEVLTASTPPPARRSVMRKRSETVGRLPVKRSSSTDERGEGRMTFSPSRKKSDAMPKPLFRARSITFKKKNRLSGSSDSTQILKGIKENWKLLLPFVPDIVADLFAALKRLDTFEFVHSLLTDDSINEFINYVEEWITLSVGMSGSKGEAATTQRESKVSSFVDFPITSAILDEFYETLKAICKKKAKKVWNISIAEHLWNISELWFRSFTAATQKEKVLEDQTITLLRRSWEVISHNAKNQNIKNFASLFYKRAIEIAPHIRSSFRHGMDSQGPKLLKMISKLLDLLQDTLAFTITLEDLGSRHRIYKVPSSAFPVFHESLLYALEISLGDDWSTDIRSAWISFSKLIEDIMAPQMADTENAGEVSFQEIVSTHIAANIWHSSSELNLCNLKISSFPSTEPLIHVEQLNLRNNSLSVISPEIHLLKNLQLLDVSKNKLKSIPSELGKCSKLQRLYLGNNFIKELPNSLGLLFKLTKLSVNNNKLKSIPLSIYRMRSLVSFDASNNKLKTCPWSLYPLLDQLNELNLTNNPFKLSNSNPEALKESIRASHFEGETSPDTLKFALLGCEGAGKTSLLASLKGDTLTCPPLSTDGIEISEWRNGPVVFSCLDFAGQEVYYDNHTLFLSPNAIHVLVFNMTESVQQSLAYWLRTLAAVSPKAPVVLVGTRADYKDSISFNSELAKDLATEVGTKNLIGTFEVSSTRGTNIDKLRKALLRLSNQLTQQMPKVPIALVRLKEIIIANRDLCFQPVLEWCDFVELCGRCEISDVWNSLDFLQQEGVVMSLATKTDEITQQHIHKSIILDPSWLTEVTSSLYSFSHSFGKADGILTQSQLAQIWRSKNYAENIHPLLMNLLESFDILSSLTSDKILFPSFLPDNAPSVVPQIWAQGEETTKNYLRRRFVLTFAPNGFFVRCLVRLIQLGDGFNIWHSGIYWKHFPIPHSGEVFVVFTAASSSVDVFITSNDDSAACLYVVTQIIESSVRSLFTDENFQIFVPLSGDVIVSVDRLEGLMAKGGTDYIGEDGYVYPLHSLIPDLFVSQARKFSATEIQEVDWNAVSAGSQASVELGTLQGRKVAQKKFLSGINATKNPTMADRLAALHILQREAWAMIMCEHPCVISIIGACMEEVSLVMEFAPAGDLYSLLYEPGEYSWDLALKISLDISKAMEHMHSRSPPLLHRDLKSPNILLWKKIFDGRDDVVAKIADLGLMSVAAVTHLTQAENPAWTAPEVMRGETFTAASDVYSFGMVLYELVMRKFPFSEFKFKFSYLLMDSICKDNLRPTLPDSIPVPVKELIEGCWSVVPTSRLCFTEITKILIQMEKQKEKFVPLSTIHKAQ